MHAKIAYVNLKENLKKKKKKTTCKISNHSQPLNGGKEMQVCFIINNNQKHKQKRKKKKNPTTSPIHNTHHNLNSPHTSIFTQNQLIWMMRSAFSFLFHFTPANFLP